MKMKAILINAAGNADQLHLQECPVPTCGPDDVLVQIKAAGINYIDIYTRNGLYKPPHYPYIPGKEGSGIVHAIGSHVKKFQVGDRVTFCVGGTGTYAEFAVLPAKYVVHLPPEISFEIAAAAILQGLTAYYLTHQTFLLAKNQTALIHAGAGGVGLLLIQLAKMLGANVITTVSTTEKMQQVKNMGADIIVNYTQASFLDAIMTYTQQVGVNVVYDAVGKTTFNDSLKSLALRGMLVSYGQASGPPDPMPMSALAEKSLYLTRPTLAHYTRTENELTQLANNLFDLIIKQKLLITIGQRYALKDAVAAHQDLESRKTIGKSVLVVG